MDLPVAIDGQRKHAMGEKRAPVDALIANDRQVVDGPKTTLTRSDYQRFIGSSQGEISTAKHIYVATKSGWFSCRSACYLAAGKPVVARDTGYSKIIPCGLGLIAFSNLEEAIDGITSVTADYQKHSLAASQIAREHFAYDHVLNKLLADPGFG